MQFRVFAMAAIAVAGAGSAYADNLVRFTFSLNAVPPPGTPVYSSFDVYADIFASPAATSTNFLSYVNSGAYNNSMINESVPGLLQGGGFKFTSPPNNNSLGTVPANAPVPFQYSVPNTLGTIAMVPTANTVGNQFIFNTADNTIPLGPGGITSTGYPVIGKVLNSPGMSTLSSISAMTTYNDSSIVDPSIASSFQSVPQTQPFGLFPYFVNITSVTSIATMGDINLDGHVNIDDFLIMDASLLRPPASLQANNFALDWAKGDLDLNGVVDSKDLALLTAASNQATSPLSTALSADPVAVPEPASLMLMAAVSLLCIRARTGGRRTKCMSLLIVRPLTSPAQQRANVHQFPSTSHLLFHPTMTDTA